MKKPFDSVVAHLEKQFPSARLEVEDFPSGAAMMWVSLGDNHWSLEFLPGQGFGASLLFGDERDWLGGHLNIFQSPEQLISWLEHELMAVNTPLSLAA